MVAFSLYIHHMHIPKIIISKEDNLSAAIPNEDNALVAFTSSPIDPNEWEADGITLNIICSPGFYVQTDEEPEDASDTLSQPCTLSDINSLLDFLEGVRDYSSITIWDEYNNELSFATALCAYTYYEQDIVDAMYMLVKSNPEIRPDSLWLVGLFDYTLNLNGELIRIYDEYLATGMVVNRRAVMTKGVWALS